MRWRERWLERRERHDVPQRPEESGSRVLEPPVESGDADRLRPGFAGRDELEDVPDPRRGTRPEGPIGWMYGGLGYERAPHNFGGIGPKGYRRSDARVSDDVCDRLTDDPRIDPSDIEVRVEDGEVFLSGRVPDRRMKRWAEDVASGVPGVRDVINEIRIAR
jgi:hypothetical protein